MSRKPSRKRRRQRLERTVARIQQRWGESALQKGASRRAKFPHIPTGFPALDEALGVGGMPRGRITTLAGRPTSGKITLAARVLALAQQRLRRDVAYIDLARACDVDYLARCGVQLADMLVVRPWDARQALELTLSLADRGDLAVILFDHWAALAAEARVREYAAAALDHLAARLDRSQTALLVIEEQPGFWGRLASMWALDSADRALRHYATLRLSLSREQWFMQGPDVRGYRARVTIEKNKLGPAQRSVSIEIRFNGAVRGDGI